ncbi:MAG: indole-3-glycerol-phosphate synthase [Candidatus Nanohaloarchaea archaeon]
MRERSELAPEVRSILETAGANTENTRLKVDPRSLEEAFQEARSNGRRPVIAEYKPTSPTTEGEDDRGPVEAAEKMVEGGASAISVLTEEEHFGGSKENLRKIREAVEVPVLRKDFIIEEEQLDEVEADLVLLIVRFLDDLEEMLEAARSRGFQVLVETHTAEEFREAVDAGADIIGINNRDLGKLEVDLSTFEKVNQEDFSGTVIAESGITGEEEAEKMFDAGADGLLIGTAIMDGDIKENVERFTGAGR